MHPGERIKEERERLGFNQADFAALAEATRKTLFNWESGNASPNAAALSAWAQHGLDVLYVVTGERLSAQPAVDAAEQVLLDSYRRCKPDAKAHLIQTAALLSAGIAPATPKSSSKSAQPSVKVGNLTSSHDGTVQVGYAGGKVSVKK